MGTSRSAAARDLDVGMASDEEIALTPEEDAELTLSLEEADRDEVIPWERALEQLRRA